MKKLILTICAAFIVTIINAQLHRGTEAMLKVKGSETVYLDQNTLVPLHVVYASASMPEFSDGENFLKEHFGLPPAAGLELLAVEEDKLGMKHYRYRATYNKFPVIGSMYIFHTIAGRIKSINGVIPKFIESDNTPAIQRDAALNKALRFIGASTYKWQFPAEESWLKSEQQNPNATFYPSGNLVYAPHSLPENVNEYSLAWEFDIYAQDPVSRKQVYVDARSGEVIHSNELLQHANASGTAVTGYVGTKTITTDYTGSIYRLRETGRGAGIETYNLNKGSSYSSAVDFTDSDNYWNNVNANLDQYATDAHYGAEMTYDYYLTTFGRNSIDNAGLKLLSYVHYSTNYVNAFWDGSRMTYGDGNSSYTPLTSLDVCGHEITHGLTSYTANLNYSYQSGALNESFSDIFGTIIEFYGHLPTADWLIGEDFGTPFRSMSNPKTYQQPNTYLGTYWYTGSGDNGGVHYNSGVQNYWFYLITMGGSGTNDNGNSYNITGIGMAKAAAIAYRTLTIYLTPTSQYTDARYYSIKATEDLYGPCSPEVIAVTNAWYAVGVGSVFNATVTADFSAVTTNSCSLPFTVSFINTSTNAGSYSWNFGDGNSSNLENPVHTYSNPGHYSVSLTINGACGSDSIVKASFIEIETPQSPVAEGDTICSPGAVTLSASANGTVYWFDQQTGGNQLATGSNFTTPVLNASTTYYVENRVSSTSVNAGPASYNFGSGSFYNYSTSQYLIFDVFQPCTLVSVLVNSGSAGNRNIILWNSQGQVLQTIPVTLTSGVQTVTLNLALTPGTGFRLGGSSMNLYRNSAGTTYPYNGGNLISITGSSAGSSYYYFYYNWVLQPLSCVSGRIPVTVTVSNTTVTLSSLNPVCENAAPFSLSGGNPVGGAYSGTGVSNNQFNPSIGAGNYIVTYTYSDEYGCVKTATSTQAVNSLPAIDAGNYNSVCDTSGVLMLYGTPSGGIFSGPGVVNNQFNPVIGPGSYTLTYSYTDPAGCSNSDQTVIVVNGCICNPPDSPGKITQTGSPFKICPGEIRNYRVPEVAGVTYNWSVPQGATILNGQGTKAIKVEFDNQFGRSGIISVVAENSCGTSSPVERIVYKDIPPFPSVINGPQFGVCNSQQTYSVTNIPGLSYNWSFDDDSKVTILSGQGTHSITVAFQNNYEKTNIKIASVNVCTTGNSRILLIRGFPEMPSAITGPSGVCIGQQGVSYSTNPVSGANAYRWRVPQQATISDGVTTSQSFILTTPAAAVVVNWGTIAGKVLVKAVNSCGMSTESSINVAFVCKTTGLGSNTTQLTMDANPNPATEGMIHLNIKSPDNNLSVITLYDLLGKELIQETVSLQQGENGLDMNVNHVSPGVYLIVLENDQVRKSVKVILN